MSSGTANLLLLLAGAIWGMGFVAQQTAMDDMSPALFIGCRFLIAGATVLPFALREIRKSRLSLSWTSVGKFSVLGTVFFSGMALQQIGLLGTSVTNAGFLTTIYVVLVPFILLVGFRVIPPWYVWPSAFVTVFGVYLLSFGKLGGIAWGDKYILACAMVWAMHVILVGKFAKELELPISMTCIQFFNASLLGFVSYGILMALGYEQPQVNTQVLIGAMPEILYTGIFSGGLAFTLQAVGQKYTRPSVAAILMGSESLFAALFGAFLLGERLALSGYIGCALILLAIIFVEWAQERPMEDSFPTKNRSPEVE